MNDQSECGQHYERDEIPPRTRQGIEWIDVERGTGCRGAASHQLGGTDYGGLRAGERGGDDDHVALDPERANRPEHRKDHHRNDPWLATGGGPENHRETSAHAGADQRDADEVCGKQNQRAEQTTEERRADHPERLVAAHRGTDEQRSEDEPEKREHEPENAVAGKTRTETADDEDDGGRHLERAGQHARRLYDGGVSEPPPKRPINVTGVLTAVAGSVLFIWLVRKVGTHEIWAGFQRIGWGLLWIVLLGGARFAVRAAAWVLCIEPPHRLGLLTAFTAVVCGDALGNVTPLGPLVGEPAKIAYVRGHAPVAPALTALAIENVLYSLGVAAMIAAGAVALLFSVSLPIPLREFSEIAIAVVGLTFVVAAWMLWRRPAVITALLPASWLGASRMEKLRAIEEQVLTFASRRGPVLPALVMLELAFHVLGVFEKHITLWMILGAPPPLLTSFIVETADRLITVAFKFVPFQVGVGEAGTGFITDLLGLGPTPGITVSIVRKARMGIWSLVGAVVLVYRGLSPGKAL